MGDTGSGRVRAFTPGAVTLAVLGVVYWTALTMLRPLIGPYVLTEGGTHTEASIALASFAVLPTLLAIPIGALTDRWGVRSLLAWGAGLMVAGGAVLFLPGGTPTVVVSQALTGLGTIAFWVALQTIATMPRYEAEPAAARNARIATFSLFLAAGQSIGPALGSALAEIGGYRLSFAVFTLASLMLLATSFAVGPPRRHAQARVGVLGSYRAALGLMRERTVLVTVIVSFTALIVLDFRNAYHPLLFTEAGLAQWRIGVLLSMAAVFGFLARPFFPPAMRYLSRRFVVGSVLIVSVCTAVGVVAFPGAFAPLAVLAAVNGFALGFAQPLTLTLMADATPQEKRGLASGLRSTANRGAQAASPAIFGAFTGLVGLSGAFLIGGGLALVVAVGCVIALPHRASTTRETADPEAESAPAGH